MNAPIPNPWTQIVLKELPELIKLLKEKFAKAHSDLPPPTSEEVIAGLETTFQDTLAKVKIRESVLEAEVDAEG